MPSGTPGLKAFTGGLLIVIIAISPFFVTCTRSLIVSFSLFGILGALRKPFVGINHQPRDPLTMECGIAESCFRGFRAPVIKVHIVFPCETHPAMHLNSAIAHGASRVTRIH